MVTRRGFLRASAAAGAAAILGPSVVFAESRGLPLGLQLYSVREQLAKDFGGTLTQLAALGYREVEAAGFFGKSAPEFLQAMTKAGLRCVSTHSPYGDLRVRFDEILAYSKAIGATYLICSSPGRKTPGGSGDAKLTLEDWRWNAGEFNRLGTMCRAAGVQFGYHNHVAEFSAINGVKPYEELLRLTDPATVTMEMDCGWVVAGGDDPVRLLRQYTGRFSMLHVKDFKKRTPDSREPVAAELGTGSIDYRPIFAQAGQTQTIKHLFVEQEQYDKPYAESLKIDAEYLARLT